MENCRNFTEIMQGTCYCGVKRLQLAIFVDLCCWKSQVLPCSNGICQPLLEENENYHWSNFDVAGKCYNLNDLSFKYCATKWHRLANPTVVVRLQERRHVVKLSRRYSHYDRKEIAEHLLYK